jgi:nucleotide-binding universal stress UspA family protein
MYKKILVALDGSKLSECILPYARTLAEKFRLPTEFVELIDYDTLMPDNVDPKQEAAVAEQKQNIQGYLKTIAASFPPGLKTECTVVVGHPAEVIVDRAAAVPDTLIAMTTHGRSGIQRWLLGSVAEKVLHATREHLLLVRGGGDGAPADAASLQSILVPLDGSKVAESVLPQAVELATTLNLAIVLVRVFNLPNLYYDDAYVPDERVWELVKEEAQQYLDGKIKELKSQALVNVSSILLEGFAAERIITLAREMPRCLIAICTHGRSGVRRWVIGSVTDRVVSHSGDPVLVVRAPNTA